MATTFWFRTKKTYLMGDFVNIGSCNAKVIGSKPGRVLLQLCWGLTTQPAT